MRVAAPQAAATPSAAGSTHSLQLLVRERAAGGMEGGTAKGKRAQSECLVRTSTVGALIARGARVPPPAVPAVQSRRPSL
eukprot:COSAG03_NODE_595_length_6813_cov_18.358505_3_plen_80_part_00